MPLFLKRRRWVMKFKRSTKLAAIPMVAVTAALVIVGCGSNTDDIYAGERVEIVNPFSSTGGTGRWLALLQPYLEEHIPGGPTVEAVSQSGGAGLNGPNYFETNTDSSGNFLLASSGSNVFPFLFGQDGVEYDFADYTAVLGSPVGGVVYTNPDTGITGVSNFCTADDLVYGAISATGLDVVMLIALEMLDDLDATTSMSSDVHVILGYDGRGDARAAFVSGDINLDFQTSAAYQSNVVPLVQMNEAVPLFTFGILDDDGDVIRDPTYPNLPSFAEVYQTCNGSALSGVEKDVYTAVLVAGFAAQKNLWVKSDAPQDKIDALLEGAQAIVDDPQFQIDKQVEVGAYEFSVGEDAQNNFSAASDISDEAYSWIATFLNSTYDTALPSSR